MNPHSILATITPVVEALESLGIPYHVGGSVASSVYGIPRSTVDIDLVAKIAPLQVPLLVRRLEADYYIQEEEIYDAISHQSSFNVIRLETMIKVDVFISKEAQFDHEVRRRAVLETLVGDDSGRAFWMASAEDVILHKLRWFHLGGRVSERQWHDVLGILKMQQGCLVSPQKGGVR